LSLFLAVDAEMRPVDLNWTPYEGVLAVPRSMRHPSELTDGEIDAARAKAVSVVRSMGEEDCVDLLRR